MSHLGNYLYVDAPITRIQVSAGTAIPANVTVTVYGARRGSNG